MLPVPEAHGIALSYSKWRLLGVISMGMTMAVKAFFDGIGKTWVHLVSALVMNVFNVLFCWLFIFGNAALGIRAMGAPGAGFAAFMATWIGLGIMIFFAARERTKYQPRPLVEPLAQPSRGTSSSSRSRPRSRPSS